MLLRKWSRRIGAVGPQLGAVGTVPATGRQGRTGESTVSMAHGKYHEASTFGVLFAASDQAVGIAVTISLTTTATLALTNPATSQKRISIKKLVISYFSGTLGAGSWYHGYNPVGTVLPSGGTLLSSTCCDIGNTVGAAAVGAARSACTVVAANILYPFATTMSILASSVTAPSVIAEDVDGIITLEPGAAWQLICVAAGSSSPKVSAGIIWEEEPYLP